MDKVSPDSLGLSKPDPKVVHMNRKRIIAGVFIVVAVLLVAGVRSFSAEKAEASDSGTFVDQGFDGARYQPELPNTLSHAKTDYTPKNTKPTLLDQRPGEIGKISLTQDLELVGREKVARDPEQLIPPPNQNSLVTEYLEQQKLLKIKESANARLAPLSFSVSVSGSSKNTSNQSAQDFLQSATSPLPALNFPKQPNSTVVANQQENKANFVKHAQKNPENMQSDFFPEQRMHPYTIMSGTLIPCTLITGLNSDLPGLVSAQVRENVFDTITGHYLLIPQGSRLIGQYDSALTYGQQRVQLVFNRLVRPDGVSIQLDGLQGSDLSGYSGLSDKVDHHYAKLATGVVLSALLSIGTTGELKTPKEQFKQNVATQASEMGSVFAKKQLDVQPTVMIRPQTPFNIMVQKDFMISPYQENP